jgi:hypothetical protein
LNRTSLLCAALLLNAATAAAGDDAVEEMNYQIGYASGDTRVKDGTDTNAYGVNGGITLPLGTYFGVAFGAEYLRTNVSAGAVATQSGMSASSPAPECGLNSTQGTATLFVRRPTLGRIGIGYGTGRTKSRCDAVFVATNTDSLSSKSTTSNAEVYLGDFTFGATRTRTKTDDIADLNSSSIAATWYPTPNLRTALTADGLDFKDTWHFQLEHQPEIFDNTTGLLLEYMTRREEPVAYYIGVGIRYYFNERIELKTRDRAYR